MTHLPSLLLLVAIAVMVTLAASLIQDTAEGFCLQLEPCHTTEGAPQP